MIITILKPKEMAEELNVSLQTFNRYLKTDKNFPVVRVSKDVRRFVKEKVMEYLIVKKNLDCVPSIKSRSLLLEI